MEEHGRRVIEVELASHLRGGGLYALDVTAHRSLHVDLVDDWLGRLMDVVPDDVFVFVLGDTGIALGEHDYAGRGTPTSHRLSYEIPYLIRHPRGETAGDDVDWYASTHDVAPTLLSSMGLTIPGKMRGEDLTQLFDGVDQEDMPDRPFSITCSGSLIMIRDKRWLAVADREQMERRLYDDTEFVVLQHRA